MSSAPAEVMFFNLRVTSLPLNFTVIINPIMMKAINIPDSGSSLIKGPTGKIVGVKAIGDPDCPQTDILVPTSVLFSLEASVGDSVPMLAFNGSTLCDAIKVQPLFHDIRKKEFSDIVNEFFQKKNESFLIAPDSYFYIDVNGVPRYFLIQHTIPDDRCYTSEKTKVYFSDPPESIEDKPFLPIHFSDLILRKSVKETVRNCLYLPLHEKELFNALKLPTSNAIMVYGGSGNGKTSFLCAVAKFLDIPNTKFVNVKRLLSEIKTKGSKKGAGNVNYEILDEMIISKLDEIFDFVHSKPKRDSGDYLVVLDDIDSLAKSYSQVKFSNQRRLLARFYSMIDKALKLPNVAIIASARSPSEIDDSLIKPGRFNNEISLEPPSLSERAALVKLFTRSLSITTADVNVLATQQTAKMSRSTIRDFVYKGVCEIVSPSGGNGDALLSLPRINEILQKMVVFAMRTELKLAHFGGGTQRRGNDFFDDLIQTDQPRPNQRPNRKNIDNPFQQEAARDRFPSYDIEAPAARPPRNKAGQEALEELRRLSAERINATMQNGAPKNMPQRKPNRGEAFGNDNYDAAFEAKPGQARNRMGKKLRKDPFAAIDEKESFDETDENEKSARNAPFATSNTTEMPKRKGSERIVGTVMDDVENPFAPQTQQMPSEKKNDEIPQQRQRFPDENEDDFNEYDAEQQQVKNNPFGQAAAMQDQRSMPSRKYVPPSADD